MAGKNVCVAALDRGTEQQIRLNSPQPTESHCAGLDIGVEINVSWSLSANNAQPHAEDGVWEPQSLRITRRLNAAELLELLQPPAKIRVSDIFGDPWRRGRNGNVGFQPGVGASSLGSLIMDGISIRGEDNGLRVLFKDADGDYVVPFQDLHVRLHQQRCPQCQLDWVGPTHRAYADRPVLLRLGLTRPYEIEGYHPPTCWLQVNHIIPLELALSDHFRLS